MRTNSCPFQRYTARARVPSLARSTVHSSTFPSSSTSSTRKLTPVLFLRAADRATGSWLRMPTIESLASPLLTLWIKKSYCPSLVTSTAPTYARRRLACDTAPGSDRADSSALACIGILRGTASTGLLGSFTPPENPGRPASSEVSCAASVRTNSLNPFRSAARRLSARQARITPIRPKISPAAVVPAPRSTADTTLTTDHHPQYSYLP